MKILYSLVAFEWSGSAWKCMYSEKNEWENIPICNCFDFQRFILNGFWVHKVIILITRQLSISGLLITFLTASFIKMRCFKKKVSNLIVNYFSVSSFWHVIA